MKALDFTKLLRNVEERFSKIQFSQALAVLYILIAMSIIFVPNQGELMWLSSTYGISSEVLIAALGISATLLLADASNRWFSVALTPLVFYGALTIFYAASRNVVWLSWVVNYAVMIALLPLALQLTSNSKLRLHHVYAVTMILLGFSIMKNQNQFVSAYVTTLYGNINLLIGFLMVLAALHLLLHVNAHSFSYTGGLLGFYVVLVAMYMFDSGRITAGLVSSTLLVAIGFAVLRSHRYFKPTISKSSTATAAKFTQGEA